MVAMLRAAFVSATLLLLAAACSSGDDALRIANTARVGRHADRTVTPVNQDLTPAGTLIDLPGLRPQVLALTPDGALLLTSGKTNELLVLDPATGAVRQRVPMPDDKQTEAPAEPVSAAILKPDKDDILSFTGLAVTADGRRVFLSSARGSVKVFAIEGGVVRASHTIPLPPANAPRREAEIPSGLALSPDGRRLYVCGNLSNRLLELDIATGAVSRAIAVGVAPYDVVLHGGRAFVSNWGGRRSGDGDLVGPAGRGTTVRVDPVRHIASEGSVSIVDLDTGEVVREAVTGLHASALAVSPDGRFVVCANAASDNLAVLAAATGDLQERIWVKRTPAELFAASPNALLFAPDGRTLWVANGTQNAVAVVHFEPEDRESRLRGLIPVGWFPGALCFDAARGNLLVANVKGIGFGRPRQDGGAPEFNSHQHHGSLSIVPVPADEQLARCSAQVDHNLRAPAIRAALLPPRPEEPPRPIPERAGEPSPIEHVVYILKENRTYDQVLGDLPEGDGDPQLCTFGAFHTPNQHALARQFVLLDNTYCAGILSADGHQWSTTGFATDYVERGFAGWTRSYPDGMGPDESDALAYAPSGFLWDHAIARGITLRNYGEFCEPLVRWRDGRAGEPDFRACFRAWKERRDDVVFASRPVVPSLTPYSPSGYVGWEMSVPDQYRADYFLEELAGFERQGAFPRLTIICLPNDHTSGTKRGCPTPAACIADNDLAFGRIVEGLSRSRFWPKMAIFAIEDDPQAGWDHVSGYRTTAYVASPYCRRGAVVSTQYNTLSILRTIELILGMPPMNQFDASATSMAECFTDVPDLGPFAALPSNVRLDEMNPPPAGIADPELRRDAEVSATLDLAQVDRAPEDVLNRILWRAMKGTAVPYPEWAVGRAEDEEEEAAERAARRVPR
jgi:YVTN family beta-propeller protein